MGIFGFKTKYDIVPKVEKLSGVVTNYSDVDVIKMNAKVVVPDGYTLIIGKKGKATDFFESGEYFLNTSILPYMCRKFGIDKVKNGKSQDNIPADFYFVNRSVCGGLFKTYKRVTMSTKAYGSYSVKVTGVFSYKVKDVREFMQSLLNEFDYIRTGEAEDMVGAWVSEVIVSELEKKNFILSDIVANSPLVVNSLKSRVIKLFAEAGLELLDFKITKYDLPKEYQAESDRNLQAQKNKIEEDIVNNEETQSEINNEYIGDDYDMPSIDNDVEDAKNLLKQFNIGGYSQESYKDELQNENNDFGAAEQAFVGEGNTILEHQKEDLQDYDLYNNSTRESNNLDVNIDDVANEKVVEDKSTIEYVPFGDITISETSSDLKEIAKESKQRRTFVDLSLNDIYTKNTNLKRCLNCGAENDKNSKHCILCGENFVDD